MSNEVLKERIQKASAMAARADIDLSSRMAWTNQLRMDLARLERQESQERYNKELELRRR